MLCISRASIHRGMLLARSPYGPLASTSSCQQRGGPSKQLVSKPHCVHKGHASQEEKPFFFSPSYARLGMYHNHSCTNVPTLVFPTPCSNEHVFDVRREFSRTMTPWCWDVDSDGKITLPFWHRSFAIHIANSSAGQLQQNGCMYIQVGRKMKIATLSAARAEFCW